MTNMTNMTTRQGRIAIFDDHMEITNPGPLPLGLSLETASPIQPNFRCRGCENMEC